MKIAEARQSVLVLAQIGFAPLHLHAKNFEPGALWMDEESIVRDGLSAADLDYHAVAPAIGSEIQFSLAQIKRVLTSPRMSAVQRYMQQYADFNPGRTRADALAALFSAVPDLAAVAEKWLEARYTKL
jgi:hypothetical protein